MEIIPGISGAIFSINAIILPTNEYDCTFRAIIIKNTDIDEFLLYQTHEIEFGRGTKKYISFVENDKPYLFYLTLMFL